MRKILLTMIFAIFLCSSYAQADKIYLKSGEILEGKVKENINTLWGDYCKGDDKVEAAGRCLSKNDIERVEKIIKKPEGAALLVKDDMWGVEKYGLQTQVLPISEEFIIGKPMIFAVILRNTSNDLKWIDDQNKANFPFAIKGPDDQDVYYKHYNVQTSGSAEPVDTGEYKNIFEKIDITTKYSIIKPGKYTIQFRGGNYGINSASIPSSNILEFNVKDGTPDKYDTLLTKLKDIIPDKRWRLSTEWYNGAPLGRKASKGALLVYSRHPDSGLKVDFISIQLWQTENESDITESADKSDEKISEYIGRDTVGHHYYIYISEKSKEFWPSAKKDIITSLNLKN